MPNYEVVAAGTVRPGDRIFSKTAYHTNDPWVKVKEVNSKENGYVEIVTTHYNTWLHRLEGIAVQRAQKYRCKECHAEYLGDEVYTGSHMNEWGSPVLCLPSTVNVEDE